MPKNTNGKRSKPPLLAVPRLGNEKERTTMVFEVTLMENLRVFALNSGKTLNQAVVYFCTEGLKREGYSPDKIPKISVSY